MKKNKKNIIRGRDKFKKYRKAINLLCKYYSIYPKIILRRKLIKARKSTGVSGIIKRYCILKCIAKNIGDNVSIQPDVYIFNPENLSIGNNVSIHPMTYIEAYGGITIGNDVSIAHGVTLLSASHKYDNKNIPIKDQGISSEPLIIGDNVWIGAKATILCGKNIGNGSIIGANCVVTKNVNNDEIVGGVPNKVLKNRINE